MGGGGAPVSSRTVSPSTRRSDVRVAVSTASSRRSLLGSSSCTAASAVARESSAVRRRRSSNASRSELATYCEATTPATDEHHGEDERGPRA